MIKFEDTPRGKRIYKYKGRKYSLGTLSKLPECVVSRPTLSGRLSNSIKLKNGETQWESINQCLTTPVQVGKPKGLHVKVKVDVVKDVIKNDEFLKTMMLMPIGSLRKEARIIQSK